MEQSPAQCQRQKQAKKYSEEYLAIRSEIEAKTASIPEAERPTVVQLSGAGDSLQANNDSAICCGVHVGRGEDGCAILGVQCGLIPGPGSRGGFAIFAGLEQVLDYLENIHFEKADLTETAIFMILTIWPSCLILFVNKRNCRLISTASSNHTKIGRAHV